MTPAEISIAVNASRERQHRQALAELSRHDRRAAWYAARPLILQAVLVTGTFASAALFAWLWLVACTGIGK